MGEHIKEKEYTIYLGVLIGKTLSWTYLINQVNLKITRGKAIVTKLDNTFLKIPYQGFFQALCHTTVSGFQIEFVNSHAEDMKKSAGGLQSTVSPSLGPGQTLGGGPRGEPSRSSAYLGFENPLL